MDPATYEHLRNKTLLFFIEKLLDPSHGNNNNPTGSPSSTTTATNTTTTTPAPPTNSNNSSLVMYTNKRTLHDLSCQFGSKGFTKEMRQIAGGSQSGLKKFLQSYPSIFRIDGDMVSYNVNSSTLVRPSPSSPSSTDNNNQEGEDDPDGLQGNNASSSIDNEAVEYFRERLMQYGIGIWVPVKSLLGHRSQAPPHIRHVSGQHIREFTNFLSKYPATFILNAQDEVLLKEFENYYHNNEKLDPSDNSSLSNPPGKLLIEKKRIVELIEFYAKCLVERGPMLVEQLFCAGNLKYDDNVVVVEAKEEGEGDDGGSASGDMMWEYFKTPGDLSTFFKMYPQCFLVHSNLVTFSDTYKVGLEYLKRQMGVGGIIVPSNPVLFQQPVRPPQQQQPPSPAKQPPTQPTQPPQQQQQQKIKVEDNSKKTSRVSPPQPKPQEQNKSLLKHRVSKILMQAINQNTEHDYKHEHMVTSPTSTNPSSRNPHQRKDSLSSPLQQHVTQFASLCASGNDTDELRAYILSRTTIVSNQRKAGQIIDEIIRANEPVSLDFEGINLGNDGQITLVQVGTGRGSVFIFDVLTQPGLIEGGERSVIGRLLCGEGEEGGCGGVVKVMHDCRNDSVNLYRQFGIRLRNVFDTQVAHIVIQQMSEDGGGRSERDGDDDGGGGEQKGKSSGGGGGGNSKNISLNNLCSVYGTVCNPFKDKVKSVYRHDQKYWSRRPLTKQMIAYASCDVMCLVPSIHNTLRTKIEVDPARLKLFNELCEEQILTHIEPDEIRSRRRLRKNEADLRALREKLDKAFEVVGGNNNNKDGVVVSNSSLVLSNREMRLLKHLNLTESEKERLKLSLKVAKKLEKMSSSPRPQPQDIPQPDTQQQQQQPLSSAESTSNSELTSLEYNENMNNTTFQQQTDPRIAQIDSLEAIINRLISDNNSNSLEEEEDRRDEYDYECGGGYNSRGPMDFVLGGDRKDCCTQTISTGDIVITKVFDD